LNKEVTMAKRTPRSRTPQPADPGNANDTAVATAARPDEARQDAERRSDSMASEPSEADIRLRAYHRYLERGGGHGLEFEDWVAAERELKTKK
jgi:DUF2934 family protein